MKSRLERAGFFMRQGFGLNPVPSWIASMRAVDSMLPQGEPTNAWNRAKDVACQNVVGPFNQGHGALFDPPRNLLAFRGVHCRIQRTVDDQDRTRHSLSGSCHIELFRSSHCVCVKGKGMNERLACSAVHHLQST